MLTAPSGNPLPVDIRFKGAAVALAATLGIAAALVARALFDADWIGYVVFGLLIVAGIGREVMVFGRYTAHVLGGTVAIALLAGLVLRLT
jgi:hypothetical protein